MNKLKRMLALVLCAAALSSALVMPAAQRRTARTATSPIWCSGLT